MKQRLSLLLLLGLVSGCDAANDGASTGLAAHLRERLVMSPNGLTETQVHERRSDLHEAFDGIEDFLASHTFFGHSHAFGAMFGNGISAQALTPWLADRITLLTYDEPALPLRIGPATVRGHLSGELMTVARPMGESALNETNANYPYEHPVIIGRGFIEIREGAVGRLATLIHEARHSDDWNAESPGHPHAKCPEDFELPELRGQPACDAIGDEGAYYTEGLFWRELIFTCRDCNEGELQLFFRGLDMVSVRVLDPHLHALLYSEIAHRRP